MIGYRKGSVSGAVMMCFGNNRARVLRSLVLSCRHIMRCKCLHEENGLYTPPGRNTVN